MMTKEKFEELVNKEIKAIPKKILEKLDNVDIVVEGEPTPYQKKLLKIRSGTKSLIISEWTKKE